MWGSPSAAGLLPFLVRGLGWRAASAQVGYLVALLPLAAESLWVGQRSSVLGLSTQSISAGLRGPWTEVSPCRGFSVLIGIRPRILQHGSTAVAPWVLTAVQFSRRTLAVCLAVSEISSQCSYWLLPWQVEPGFRGGSSFAGLAAFVHSGGFPGCLTVRRRCPRPSTLAPAALYELG